MAETRDVEDDLAIAENQRGDADITEARASRSGPKPLVGDMLKDTSTNDMPASRVRFSLLTLLLLVSLLCSAVYNFRASVAIKRLEEERLALKTELGYLSVEDEDKAYVKQLASLDQLTWRYRVYLPPKGTFGLRTAFEWTPDGFPEYEARGRSFQGFGEFLMTMGFRRGANGSWILRVVTPARGTNVSAEPHQVSWLSTPGSGKSSALSGDQQERAANKPIEIVRFQASKLADPDERLKFSPSDGFMVWFEPLAWNNEPLRPPSPKD